jgi:hypothetical protein
MTDLLDRELKAAFETATEYVEPPAGLAESARRGARKRRQRTLVAAAAVATAVILTASGATFLARHHVPAATNSGKPVRIVLPAGSVVSQLATGGRYLYVVDNQNDILSAYDARSGRLVRSITVPDTPSALAIGPGGYVWLSFTPSQSAGPNGIWLLSPDLRAHSALLGESAGAIIPLSANTAWMPDQYSLFGVSMPTPGASGTARMYRPIAHSQMPPNTAPGQWAGILGQRVVVRVTNGYGFDSRLVVAGRPHITYGGEASDQVGFVAQSGDSLWVATYAVHGQNATPYGPLVRVDKALLPTTPAAILASRILAKTKDVWTSGGTVWAATAARGHSLVCFTAGSQLGPIVTLPVKGQVSAVAATGDTVFVGPTPYTYLNGHATGVISYRIPPACR